MNTPDFFTGSDGRTVTPKQVMRRLAEMNDYRTASLLRFNAPAPTLAKPDETPPAPVAPIPPCAQVSMVAL